MAVEIRERLLTITDDGGPADQFIEIKIGSAVPGEFRTVAFSVDGTFVATITAQRSFDDGIKWRTLRTLTGEDELDAEAPIPGTSWRIGVFSGDYTSGTINLRVGY